MSRYSQLKDSGMSEVEIARAFGMSTTQLRAEFSNARNAEKASQKAQVQRYKDHGYSVAKIVELTGIPDRTIRDWLKEDSEKRANQNQKLADQLKAAVDEKGMIDVGEGVSRYIGVSDQRLTNAEAILKEQGYEVITIWQPQATNRDQTTPIKVLCPPGMTKSEVWANRHDIHTIDSYTEDGGESYRVWQPPQSIDSKRIFIRYGDEGGSDMEGVIQIRRNVEDLEMGNSSYAQVRVAVDGTHYMKGMAIYADDIPEGYDVVYNTNKPTGTDKYKVFKPMKDDPENPFGSLLKVKDGQHTYVDSNGETKLSAINKVREEGDWEDWKKTLASQFLSKQSEDLITKQLELSYANRAEEYDSIMKLQNPVIKKKLLGTFAEDCDSASVYLKAAPLPGQKMQVILPLKTIRDDEVYAPNFHDGETVALVRFPHGGTFEIPVLKVNNKQAEGVSVLGKTPLDAVGINSKVAAQLSGADFDGDTVLVIPFRNGLKINSRPPLEGLKDFDPKKAYPGYEGMKEITKEGKQHEMGKVTNLINDMTLKGATDEELTRAVKHSMVVIDAEKHKLDYRRSFDENGIAELKEKYQGKSNAGASTLISRAKSVEYVNERKEGVRVVDPKTGVEKLIKIDPNTGEKLYTETGRLKRVFDHVDPDTGKKVYVESDKKVQEKSTKMAEHKDAFELSSGTWQETLYATYANRLKAMANEARKEYLRVPNQTYSPSAKKTYATEVASLVSKLNDALKNSPRERQAQLLADSIISAKKKENPEIFSDKDDASKEYQRAIVEARARVGAKRTPIQISDREWEAIQAGAVSNHRLEQIMKYTDTDEVRRLAMPRDQKGLSDAQISRIKAMSNSRYTTDEIATAMGISTSTVIDYLKEG